MDEVIKYRLVGMVVLITLLIVLFPFVFKETMHFKKAQPARQRQTLSSRKAPTVRRVVHFNQAPRRTRPKSTPVVFSPKSMAHVSLNKVSRPRNKMHSVNVSQKIVKKRSTTTHAVKRSQQKVHHRASVTPSNKRHRVASITSSKKVHAISKPRRINKSLPKPVVSSQAWVVQLASFTTKGNARALQKKLKGLGFSTFSRDMKNAQGIRFTRVFAGPENKRQNAERLAARLQKASHVKGIIVRYSSNG